MNRLLELGPDRIAAETARSLEAIAELRRDRRRTALVVLAAALAWGLGLVLLGLAGHTRNGEMGTILFWSGLVIGNAGPMYAGLWYWSCTAA